MQFSGHVKTSLHSCKQNGGKADRDVLLMGPFRRLKEETLVPFLDATKQKTSQDQFKTSFKSAVMYSRLLAGY